MMAIKGKILAAVATLMLASSVSAQYDRIESETTYYNEPERSEIVGHFYTTCNGNSGGNGYPTPYSDYRYYGC